MELVDARRRKKKGDIELSDVQGIQDLYFPWEPLDLMPIGDIQYDGRGGAADIPRLRRHLMKGMDRGAYFIGTGDITDTLSPSNRQRMAAAGLYDTADTVFDNAITNLENELKPTLEPTRGRWFGLVQGHHYYPHLDGTTTDTRFAEWLDCAFLGSCALIRVFFRDTKNHVAQITIWVHHGAGGSGVLPTAIYNKLYHQKIRYPRARVFIMGHVPQLGHVKLAGLDSAGDPGTPHLIHEDTSLVAAGGWARSYQQGSKFRGRAQGGYAEQGMMPPAVLGGAVIHLEPIRLRVNGKQVSYVEVTVTS